MKLPEMAVLLIRLIGRDAALQLMDPAAFGGKNVPIPKGEIGRGDKAFAALAETVGMDNARELCKRFGGTVVYVPLLDSVRLGDRNRQIVEAYNAGAEVWALSSRFRMSEKQIRNILKRTDLGQHVEALIEVAQGTLF